VLTNDTDAEGNALTSVVVSDVAHGTLALNANGSFTYTPTANYDGPDSFTYKANDGSLDSNAATVAITIVAVNDAPIANSQTVATDEDTAKAITLTATDVEGSPLTYTIVAAPAHGTLSGTAPALTYTPAANYNGADNFTFKANDGALDSNVATVAISVVAVNDAPVAANDSYSIDEDTSLTVAAPGLLANDTDIDSTTLTAAVVTAPAHGTLALAANGSFTYTPAANYNGPDSFTYKANDGALDSNLATVWITVVAVNDAPAFVKGADQTVVQNSGLKTVSGWATSVTAGPADESGQAVNFIVTSDNAGLFATQPAIDASGTLTFTPAAGATGIAHVTVQLHDNGGTADGGADTSAAQSFTITVTAAATPTLSIGDSSLIEGNSGTKPMPFVVTLSVASAVPVTVSYSTLAGTASSSRDFLPASGTLTFAPGETSKTITVMIIGDTLKESNETLVVRLSNPVNATMVKSEGTGTILDDN
jgi:VCBS repeat-containing protein